MNKKLNFRWIPSIVLMVSIFIFSSIPSESMPSFGFVDLLVKKGGHMLGYGLLAISFLYGFGKENTVFQRLAILFSILYALTDEWHQSYVLGRNGSLWDVAIDAIGSMISIYLVSKYHLLRKFNL